MRKTAIQSNFDMMSKVYQALAPIQKEEEEKPQKLPKGTQKTIGWEGESVTDIESSTGTKLHNPV